MKIKYFLVILLFILLLVSTQNAVAGGRRLGTAGAVELTIPMGARSVGMGGSNIANVRGTESMYWNPAGLALLTGTEASFSYMTYFADMNISYFTVGSKIGELGALGFSLQAMNIGDIVVTTIERPEGTGQVLSPSFITLNASYSRSFTDRINFGLNVKLISERVGVMSASALAFDFGLQYVTPFGVDFGVVMRNLGTNIHFTGTAAEFDTNVPFANPNATTRKTMLDLGTHELPATMSMGVAYRYTIGEMHGLILSSNYSNNNFSLDQVAAGLEYNFNNMFSGRVGYNTSMYPDDYPEAAKEYQYGLTFGFGVNLPVGDNKIMFDYAYRDMDLFNANQYFSIGFTF